MGREPLSPESGKGIYHNVPYKVTYKVTKQKPFMEVLTLSLAWVGMLEALVTVLFLWIFLRTGYVKPVNMDITMAQMFSENGERDLSFKRLQNTVDELKNKVEELQNQEK